MYQNRRHITSRKSSHRKERGIERFISSRLFIVLGVLFLLIGLYYSLSSSEGSGSFFELFKKALQPTNAGAEPAIEFSGKGIWVLLLCFTPAILAISISGFLCTEIQVNNISCHTYYYALFNWNAGKSIWSVSFWPNTLFFYCGGFIAVAPCSITLCFSLFTSQKSYS